MADIRHLLDKIRTAIYGKEVRGSLADGLEAVNNEVEDATEVAVNVEQRQDAVEQQFDDVLNEWTGDQPISNEETIAARTNRNTGENWTTIGQRMDEENKKVTEQLADIAPYNVKEYGAKADNFTDDQQAIQAAVDDAYANGGGVVFLPEGKYVLNNPIKWKSKVSLIGSGVGKSILKTVTSEKSIKDAFSAIEEIDLNREFPLEDCTFRDFEVDGSGVKIPYAYDLGAKGLFLLYMKRARFENLYIHDTIGTGIGCDFLSDTIINGVVAENCGRLWQPGNLGGAGIGIGTGAWLGDENRVDSGLVITNCVTINNGNYGIFCEHQSSLSQGNYAENITISNCIAVGNRNVGISDKGNRNITISNCVMTNNLSSGFTVEDFSKEGILSNCSITDNGEHGVGIEARIQDYKIDNCIISRNVNRGIYLRNSWANSFNVTFSNNEVYDNFLGISLVRTSENELNTVSIINNKIFNNKAKGIELAIKSNRFWMENNKIFDNGFDPGTISRGNYGVTILYDLKNVQIKNNHVFDSRDGVEKTQFKGIFQHETSAIKNGSVENNDCSGNISHGLELAGAIENLTKKNNKGDAHPPLNGGGKTIQSGSVSVDVTHGMSFEPARENIVITPINNLGNANKFWISNITDTKFRINVDVDPGSETAKFAWRIAD